MLTVLLLMVAAVGHCVLWVGIVNRVHGVGWPRPVVDGVTHTCMAVFAVVPIAILGSLWRWPPSGDGLLARGGPVAWYLGFALLVAVASSLARLATRIHPERARALRSAKTTPIDLGEGATQRLVAEGGPRWFAELAGNELLKPVLAEKELEVERLPAELEGLRIAHLTDLHMSGRVELPYFEQMVDATLAAEPDLIALTGDLVEFDPQHAWVESTLLRLAAPEGVWFVLGNHDLRHDNAKLRRTLTAGGLINLGSGAVEVELRGKRVRMVGNELPWFPPAGDPRGDGSPVDLTVALVHGPDQFRWAERNGIDLVLAGHNHGGQVCLPLLGPVVTPSVHGTRYAGGSFRRGRTTMHVSRGLGSLAPLRYFCPPELAVVTLCRPASAG